MLQSPQRPLLRHAARHKQRVQGSRERTHVIGAGGSHIADDIHMYGAQPLQRNVRRNITELRSQHALHVLLYFPERLARNQHGARLGKRHTPFAVDSAD